MLLKDCFLWGLEMAAEVESLVKLWIHEVNRTWRDTLPHAADQIEFDALLHAVLTECGPFTLPQTQLPVTRSSLEETTPVGQLNRTASVRNRASDTQKSEKLERAASMPEMKVDKKATQPESEPPELAVDEDEVSTPAMLHLDLDKVLSEPILMTAITEESCVSALTKPRTVSSIHDLAPRFEESLAEYNLTHQRLDMQVMVESFITAAVFASRPLAQPHGNLVLAGSGGYRLTRRTSDPCVCKVLVASVPSFGLLPL